MAKQLIILCCVIAMASAAVKLKEFYSWKMLDWNFPEPFMKQQALQSGALIPQNALPVGIERWRNKLFVSVPRWRADSEYEPCYELKNVEYQTHCIDNNEICEEDTPSENRWPESVVTLLLPVPCSPKIKSPAPNEQNNFPSEILAVLGEAKKVEETWGQKIPAEIAERWGNILVHGLTKEQKEALLTKLLIPENFQLAKAPKLNAEVASVLSDEAKNRDERIEKMQNQLGIGIAGIAQLISELISKDISKIDIITQLSEVNQILLNLHYEKTLNRRRLIIPILDKTFVNVIQDVKRDKFLFGNNLSEHIKTTKSIEQSSLHLKKTIPLQPRRPTTNSAHGNLKVAPRQLSEQAVYTSPAQANYYHMSPPPANLKPPPATRHLPSSLGRLQDRRIRR